MHALDTHSPTSYLPQSYINISIISLVYHVELYVLWKHSGQHPNYLKATPIYRLLVWFTFWSLRMLWKHTSQHPNCLKATPIY